MWNNLEEVKPKDFQHVLIKLDSDVVTVAQYEYGTFEPVGWELRWDNSDDNYITLSSGVIEWSDLNV